ncbi:MAG: 6-phosphogluconolactonase [Parcubacteria group bacterium]
MARVVEAFGSPREAAQEAADAIAAALRDAILEHGRATFVATGGRTPGSCYDILARALLDWRRVTVTLTDERWVDPRSADSNERMVRDRLLVEQAASATFAPLKSDRAAPEEAVADAEARLKPILPADVTLLGMGEDGHVASLFPGGTVDAAGLAVPAQAAQPRLSLTLDALEPTRLTVVLISGDAKRRVLEEGSGLPIHLFLARTKAPVRILWSP